MGSTLAIAAIGVLLLIPVLIAAAVQATASAMFGHGASQPSPTALTDILGNYLLTCMRPAAGQEVACRTSIVGAWGRDGVGPAKAAVAHSGIDKSCGQDIRTA